MPTELGGYTVRGRISSLTSGAQVWLADDRSLGRRVLIHLLPDAAPEPPPRSSRLRLLSTGELNWNDRDWTWHAFAAPTGAPLADMIPAGQPLNWPDSRLILEQIVEELIQSEIDRSRPKRLGVNHFWCEPGGRIFLLDFPMPSVAKSASTDDPMALVRQATTLLLEGRTARMVAASAPAAAARPPRLSTASSTTPTLART